MDSFVISPKMEVMEYHPTDNFSETENYAGSAETKW
jgi:hypothetical protein